MLGLGLSKRWNYWESLTEQKHGKLFQCNTGKTFYNQLYNLKTYYQHLHLKMVRKKSQSHSIICTERSLKVIILVWYIVRATLTISWLHTLSCSHLQSVVVEISLQCGYWMSLESCNSRDLQDLQFHCRAPQTGIVFVFAILCIMSEGDLQWDCRVFVIILIFFSDVCLCVHLC